jgi:hypothetical protein
MAQLGAVITEAIVHHYGREEFLQRLAHPFWFQSFGAVMGMGWHSSGITTSVIGLAAAVGRAFIGRHGISRRTTTANQCQRSDFADIAHLRGLRKMFLLKGACTFRSHWYGD